MNNNIKIVFMGTPQYATVIFEKLLVENYTIQALFTQPDKKVGRKQVITAPHIKQFCLDNALSLPIYQPTSLKEESSFNAIKSLQPDFIIVAAYGQILPQNILDIAPCINLHASLLPKYRGASPIQQSLLNNDKYTGVTAMMMEKGLDSGDILALQYLKIEEDMDVSFLFDSLGNVAANLTITTLNNFENIKAKKQNNTQVSYCGKITKDDGLVSLNNAKTIYQKYKAFNFWPGIFLSSGLKIKECFFVENQSINEEAIILDITKNYIIVGCKQGTLKITQVQPVSKKQMNVADYIRGARLSINDMLV